MEKPRIFISYSQEDVTLARRLKDDLTSANCDPWQFGVSAVPGTDAWGTILERIEKSDFFLVLLSPAALHSKAVDEEISHAHYCSLNHPEQLPRIIPIVLEDGLTIPRKLVRAVRLRFSEKNYDDDFAVLLRSVGIEESPFGRVAEVEATFTRSREFDAEREAAVYATRLLESNAAIAAQFQKMSANLREAVGGHFRVLPAQTLIWEMENFRDRYAGGFSRKAEYTFLIFFPLRGGLSNGFFANERVVVKIHAVQERRFRPPEIAEETPWPLADDTLQLKFEGFQTVSFGAQ